MRNRFFPIVFAAVSLPLASGSLAVAEDIDVQGLVAETQKVSEKLDDMTLVWWLPEEFWAASFAQTPQVTATQAEQFLKIVRPYTMVAVVTGDMGPFGGVTYKSESYVRANVRIVDSQNKSYAPLSEEQISPDVKNFLEMMKPVMANLLGPMGKNMHFLVFPGKTAAGAQIASAKGKGHLQIRVGRREFKWRLPLDSVLAPKRCPGCKEKCKGSWNFCPWCGQKLGEK